MYRSDVDGFFSFEDYIAYGQIVSNFRDGNFVEIGCWKGKSLCSIIPVLIENNYKNIVAVDHWLGSISERDTSHKEATYSDIYLQFFNNLKSSGFDDKVKILKMDSVEAASNFDDGFFDVVFIDGDHDYDGVRRDVDAWTPKVKTNGILCGHDSHHAPIIQVLNETFGNAWSRVGGGVWQVNI